MRISAKQQQKKWYMLKAEHTQFEKNKNKKTKSKCFSFVTIFHHNKIEQN